ncbi:hypothetical protein GA0070618_4455 [Micromonospora echinospora]|uniref:Uncharacterized protein n=1 Tax=Micromonospora echinospora TaxID=1877 RepID=A0A1C4YVU8_MICEC|nr:hypothetical protein GA0070618_4455 [Micromonospora echinospora]
MRGLIRISGWLFSAFWEPGSVKKCAAGLQAVPNLYGEKGTGTHTSGRHIDYVYFWKRVPEHQVMWMTDYSIVGAPRSARG